MDKKLEWISIEVDTHCNIRCTMCPIGHNLVKDQGQLSITTLFRLLELAPGWTDKIALAVMGEPLLNPQIIEMIEAINNANFKSMLWTNGLLVNERRATSLLEAGLSKIIFSFELIDRELHERIRTGVSYDKVKQNLDHFIDLRNKINPETEISVWNIIPESDCSLDIPQHISKEYDDIEIYLSYAMDWMGTVPTETSTQEILGAPSPCNQIQNYMSVSYNGDVLSCCNDYNHEAILGNIHEANSLDDIWYSETRMNLVSRMKTGNLQDDRPCNTCSAPYVKEGVERLFKFGDVVQVNKDASNHAKGTDGQATLS